jgi:hypothetical protein
MPRTVFHSTAHPTIAVGAEAPKPQMRADQNTFMDSYPYLIRYPLSKHEIRDCQG